MNTPAREAVGVRRSRPGRGCAVASAFLILLTAGAVQAYVQTNPVDQGFGDIGLKVQNGSLVLRLESHASWKITDGTDLTALTDSMARWTNVTTSNATVSEGTRFTLTSPVDAVAALGNDGLNRVYFAQTDTTNRLQSAIAVSFFFFSTSTGLISDCDTVFNESLYSFSTATPANPNQSLGANTFDLGEIATHEMGHCLGLEHTPVVGRFDASTGLEVSGLTSGDFTYQATLFPYATGTIQGRSLAQDDISGISFIYPNTTLTGTTATISGRILSGADGSPIKGAHVVAVSTATPDLPLVGALSGVQAGGPGGEYTLVGLPPGSYYLRIEPMVGTSNPFRASLAHFTGFDTGFPWEYYNGSGESGNDTGTDRTALTVAAGQTVSGIDILTNVAAPDPNEPNNTRASATPIACEEVKSVSIAPKGDIDYYALAITSPTSLQIDVSAARAGSTLDAVAAVFDAAGNRLAFADNSIGLDPVLFVDLYGSGTYYVAVASYNDSGFTGTDARTVGNYTLTARCSIPKVRAGTCPGRVLYAGAGAIGWVLAVSDADRDLRYDGESYFAPVSGAAPGALACRRDGGILVPGPSGAPGAPITAFWDGNGDFIADRSESVGTGLSDAPAVVSARRSGAEYLYAGDLFGGGSVVEMVDTGGGFLPERSTTFTDGPQSVAGLAIDEAGTVYVLDALANEGLGQVLAYRDRDGDGIADASALFLPNAPTYGAIVARSPGEVYAADTFAGRIDRIVDVDGDGMADVVAPYATGLSFPGTAALTFDENDVLYVVDGGNRVLALPDDNGDHLADRQVQFSPLIDGLGGITFGPGPPETVSPPGSFHPVTVMPSGSMLRLTWEDQGPTVPAYNVYEGVLGSYYSHAPLICRVGGTADGGGGRFLDITPSDGGSHYYLVTASDSCGEGSPGRGSDGRRRPLPGGSCGAVP
ncbi:MAG TPA: hypothetical protein VFT43_09100 [Candidatus Polarisedimenticolia bacterium]|nr:hypothetical protein [Candidatus Polarisedimenticolia bacterium]